MTKALISAASVALAAAVPATAEPQSYRLSQAEIDATMAAASHRPETPALLPPEPEPGLFLPNLPAGGSMPSVRDKRPHGVAGFAVSSDGGYALYSATSVPIGEESYASFAFSYSRMPGYNYLPYGALPYGSVSGAYQLNNTLHVRH